MINYTEVKSGDYINWYDSTGDHLGIAEYDERYTGKLRIGGRSIKDIWENSKEFRIVAQWKER